MRNFLLFLLLVPSLCFGDSESTFSGKTAQAHIIQNSGTSLQPRPYLNFSGSGVSCTDANGKTNCAISGGGGGGGGSVAVKGNGSTVVASADTLNFNTDFNVTQSPTGTANVSSNVWTRNSPNIYPANITDNVGIGTITPVSALTVAGLTTLQAVTSESTANRILNPTFVGASGHTPPTSWTYTDFGGDGSLTLSGSHLIMFDGSDDSMIYQSVSTTIGKTYLVSAVINSADGSCQLVLRIGNASNSGTLFSSNLGVGVSGTISGSFVATATTTFMTLYNAASGVSQNLTISAPSLIFSVMPSQVEQALGSISVGADYTFTPPANGLIVEGNVGIGSTNPGKSLDIQGTVRALAFIKSGGTAGQFLKADGSVDSSSYITGNQTITLSGDVTGSGATAITSSLKSTGTAGTYRSTTFDAQGRETSGTNPTTFSGYAISDTSANLAAALTDESGTGLAVFNNGATFIAPILGTPASGVATNLTGTASALSIGGNAATATALAANGTNCSAGNYPLGVDASGNSESCTAVTSSQWATQNSVNVSLAGGNVGIGTTLVTTAALTVMNGNVGIGTWVPSGSLVVKSGSTIGLTTTGNVGIGSTAPQSGLTLGSNNHLGSTGTAPTVASNDCGSTSQGAVNAGSTDLRGSVVVGTLTVTSCAITFNVPFGKAPVCLTQDDTNILGTKNTQTTSKLTITSTTSMSSDTITWVCIE